MKTRWCVLFGILVLWFVSRVVASEKDSVQFKKYALQFHLDEKFRWSGYQGSLISFKVHFSPDRAFRFGIYSDYDHYKYEQSNTRGSTYSGSVTLYPTWLYYQPARPLRFYWGVGPIIGVFASDRKDEQSSEGGNWQTMNKFSQTDWTLGAQAVAGIEFCYKNLVGTFLEYNRQATFSYTKFKDKLINQ